jgi:hypothetical protein
MERELKGYAPVSPIILVYEVFVVLALSLTVTVDLYQHALTKMREAHAVAVDNILKREHQAT